MLMVDEVAQADWLVVAKADWVGLAEGVIVSLNDIMSGILLTFWDMLVAYIFVDITNFLIRYFADIDDSLIHITTSSIVVS